MNILIKLMSIVSLVIAPTLAQINSNKSHEVTSNKKEIKPVAVVTKPNNTVQYK